MSLALPEVVQKDPTIVVGGRPELILYTCRLLTDEQMRFHGVERLPEEPCKGAVLRGSGISDPEYKKAKIALYERAHELRGAGLNNPQIAARLDTSPNVIDKLFTKGGREIYERMLEPTAYEKNIDEALRLRRKGLSVLAVSREMGVTQSAAREWLDRYRREEARGE